MSINTFDQPRRFLALDVETPNGHNDRISSIAFTLIEDGQIRRTESTLVDPETYFAGFNIALTGITPEMVRGAPKFPEVWAKWSEHLANHVLVAHNAAFDLRVIAKCLDYYGMQERQARYVCTCRLGRRCYPELPDHKLDTMCACLRIPLEHHQAESDCVACAKLLQDYLARGTPLDEYMRRYDWRAMKTLPI